MTKIQQMPVAFDLIPIDPFDEASVAKANERVRLFVNVWSNTRSHYVSPPALVNGKDGGYAIWVTAESDESRADRAEAEGEYSALAQLAIAEAAEEYQRKKVIPVDHQPKGLRGQFPK